MDKQIHILPSIKLLSKLFNNNTINKIKLINSNLYYEIYIRHETDGNIHYQAKIKKINIYELMNLLKIWASINNYHLDSKLIDAFWFCWCQDIIHDGATFLSEYAISEPSSVIEVCELMLNQKRII